MKFKIDLHVHSRYSGDNDSDPEEMILRAIALGLDGLAFTEHYFYSASEPVEALREKYKETICIFRGVEFSAVEGHCLVFGADTDRMNLSYPSVAELVGCTSRAGGVVIPSHPYRQGSGLGDQVRAVNGITALEGYNGANMHVYNLKAIEAAEALKIPFTGGSDAHAPREVGSCYTEFSSPVAEENLVKVLKEGNYRGVDTRKISRGFP